jgi:hypothetical protein
MKTMLWTVDGDLATGSANEILAGSGATALTNHIYYLLRQSSAGMASGFNILNYIGRTSTPARIGKLKTDLGIFLNANLNMPEPVVVAVTKLNKTTLAVSVYSSRVGPTATTSSFSYKNGSWKIDLPDTPTTVVAAEPDNTPNTLLDR